MVTTERKTTRPRGRIPACDLAQHENGMLVASYLLFQEHGFARVSVDMIARAARVSPKTIYARYGGKRGLFAAVIGRMLAVPLATLDLLDESDQSDPSSVLEKFAGAFLCSILDRDRLSLHRMLIAEATHQPELSELFYKEGPAKTLSALARWLALQDAAGRMSVPDPERAAEIFISLIESGILHRALLLNVLPSETDRPVLLETAVSAFCLAYAPKSPQSQKDRRPRPVDPAKISAMKPLRTPNTAKAPPTRE